MWKLNHYDCSRFWENRQDVKEAVIVICLSTLIIVISVTSLSFAVPFMHSGLCGNS